MNSKQSSDSRPELFFALVGPAGARLSDLSHGIREELKTFGYTTIEVRLSHLLENFQSSNGQVGASEFERIKYLQEKGNALRRALDNGAALARAAIAAIRERRAGITRNPDRPAPAHAYILSQLKHPSEVDLLRQVYGSSFHLIGGHASEKSRAEELARVNAQRLNRADQEKAFLSGAYELIRNDEKQEDELGQNTRDTYPKADLFTNLEHSDSEAQVRRFVQLLFGHPLKVPTAFEYAMYQASAISLRSSDVNRQVGAVIVNIWNDPKDVAKLTNAELIAVGMNEVPRGGGASYYDGCSPDARDQALQRRNDDRATEFKTSALAELIEKLQETGLIEKARSTQEVAAEILPRLAGTQFMNSGEFSRPVHAEMAALIDAARRGVAVDEQSMFVTTFPCHNCAKHIIAAGLRRVVYLEPYPKSRAGNLYREEVDLDGADDSTVAGKVVFRPFSGVAPRQYGRLFSMSERGKRSGRTLSDWEANRNLLIPLYVTRHASEAYLLSEREELKKLPPEVYKWDPHLADVDTEAPTGGGGAV